MTDYRARTALAQPEPQGPSERIISIAKAVQKCAFGWEPDVRVIGNVCAEDVADLCSAVLARWGCPAPAQPETSRPEPPGYIEWIDEYLKADRWNYNADQLQHIYEGFRSGWYYAP